ncbi:plasmid replication protein RepC [Mangrovicoccus ximenensis]|uniref:plasmid replication protein RepC n=1 Tax=Mangrovicoccus ximenensis TaxID=1911570 RepID=UPI001EEE6447|nr:plasmid replication protein RepC [Mangrovicoccus ximenensis]
MHFRQAPGGAGQPQAAAAEGKHLPKSGGSGWRKQDDAVLRAEELGREGQALAVGKSEALIALKRAAPLIGLKPAQVLLMDTLCAFSQAQDWEDGQSPIVWPSNALLTDRTGLSLSALRRHLRKLCEAGVLSFRDSPNGKRWGRRHADGQIADAYGFDLSPLAARARELARLHADHEAERHAASRLRRQITVLRRTIAERIALLSDAAGQDQRMKLEQLEAESNRPGTLDQLTRKAEALARQLAQLDAELAPKGTGNDTHIEDTINSQESKSTGEVIEQPLSPPASRHTSHRHTCRAEDLHRAFPAFAAWGGPATATSDWVTLAGLCRSLATLTGLADRQWTELKQQIGDVDAVKAMCLLLEKTAQGQIHSPSAYLHGMIRKAKTGDLHLDRSIRGHLRRAQAA